jgi:uncharacterized protein
VLGEVAVLPEGIFENLTYWHRLIKKCDIPGVRALIATGADVNARSRFGWTPLMLAAHAGWTPIVECLMANGADPSATSDHNHGYSALALAAIAGHVRTMQKLLDAGASVNVSPLGRSLIEFAQMGIGNSKTCRHVELLRGAGAD